MRSAVYAGSFDPPTMGHIDIVKRIAPLFDKIYLVVAENIFKKTLFSTEERVLLLREAIKDLMSELNIEVLSHRGLTVDLCRKLKVPVMVRGIRAMSDFEREFQLARVNRKLDPKIETLHVMTDEKYFFLSSSLIKELAFHGGSLKEMLPENVLKALSKKIKSLRSEINAE